MELREMEKETQKKPRAIALLSGGLDSTLAISLLLDMGVEVEAVNFTTIFCNCSSERKREGCGSEARRVSQTLGVKLSVFGVANEYLDIIKNPKHGWGSSMNPCIDCRIYMFRRAKEYMEKTGADFIVTGEVLGQRPMSQHLRAMKIIEQESGLEGLIVRPLCAKLLAPSKPEKEGLIDREKLLALKGRSRKPQIQLAAEKGITDYACPAGGCLLADKIFGRKLRELLRHQPDAGFSEVRLLKYGRHFRLADGSKIIVGRDQQENDTLERLGRAHAKLQVIDGLGPVTLAPPDISDEMKLLAASITARYSQGNTRSSIMIRCWRDGQEELLEIAPVDDTQLSAWRVE
jgi:tRNA U34 2-thiouridine synthase MnmA/TrmU